MVWPGWPWILMLFWDVEDYTLQDWLEYIYIYMHVYYIQSIYIRRIKQWRTNRWQNNLLSSIVQCLDWYYNDPLYSHCLSRNVWFDMCHCPNRWTSLQQGNGQQLGRISYPLQLVLLASEWTMSMRHRQTLDARAHLNNGLLPIHMIRHADMPNEMTS